MIHEEDAWQCHDNEGNLNGGSTDLYAHNNNDADNLCYNGDSHARPLLAASSTEAVSMLHSSGRLRQRRWGKYKRIFNFVLIYSTVIVDFMGYTLLAPLSYYFIVYFNVNMGIGTASSLLISSYGSGLFLSSLLLGSMSDSYGRARVILWALCGTAAAYFAQAVAWSFTLLVLFRFIGGLFGGTRPVLLAYLSDTVTPNDMPFYSSLIGLCVAASQCLASAAGGALATISLQTPLWVSCFITALTAVLVALWLEEPIQAADGGSGGNGSTPLAVSLRMMSRTYNSFESMDVCQYGSSPPLENSDGRGGGRGSMSNRRHNYSVVAMKARRKRLEKRTDDYMRCYEWYSIFICCILLGGSIQFNFSSWITLLPLLCGNTWNLDSDITGYILASQGIITIISNLLIFMPLSRYINIATIASLGGLCHSLIIIVAYIQYHHILLTIIIGYCITLGNTLTLAALPVVSKVIAPLHRRGFVNAIIMSTQNVSMVIGPLLGGYMLDKDTHHRLPYIVMSIFGIIGLMAGIYIRINISKVEMALKCIHEI